MFKVERAELRQSEINIAFYRALSTEDHLLLRLRNECDTFGFAFVSGHHAGQAS
jgi:hypothetical protein